MYNIVIYLCRTFLFFIFSKCILESTARHCENTVDDRVFGGSPADPGEFKYQVSFRVKNNKHFCGGSIIGSRTMLSAAHCFISYSPDDVIAVFGTNKLNSGGLRYKPQKIILHPDYEAVYNDIALIIFDKEIQFDENIQMINISNNVIESGERVVLSGWGRTQNINKTPNDLQKIELETISDIECKISYPGIEIKNHICTLGRIGKGACYGDSGGPLASKYGELIGIVSFGNIHCAMGYPDVYTRISSFYDWINSNKI